MGNQELLAVKLPLEEWQHWLEGAGQPFVVWTNHKTFLTGQATHLLANQVGWLWIDLIYQVCQILQ